MSKRWADHFTERAKLEGYKARSVYKLREIHERFRVFKLGDKVLDLGCYPGSWSQFALEQVGERGRVFGIDILEVRDLSDHRFSFHRADVLRLSPGELLDLVGPVDVVLSDLAPSTTGIRVVDSAKFMELVLKALEVAKTVLKPNGIFVFKAFESKELGILRHEIRSLFRNLKAFRPKATRARSKEVFTICLGLKT
ncbi:MAG: SAM-dependent methyltransferase [Desulfatiglandales bacterium]